MQMAVVGKLRAAVLLTVGDASYKISSKGLGTVSHRKISKQRCIYFGRLVGPVYCQR
jgi:hypothetical protein